MTNHDVIRLKQAELESTASKCVKHSVGCVICDKDGRIISSGYNGTPPNEQNCCDRWPNFDELTEKFTNENGAMSLHTLNQSHHEWAAVNEVHAEINAIIRADYNKMEGGTIYVTMEPCPSCSVTIAATPLARVVCGKEYHRSNDRTRNILRNKQYLIINTNEEEM